jgi:hypothetical protein
MRWRDIRFEKPTKDDADKLGGILQLLDTGSICRWNWSSTAGAVAWMPLSELPAFDRIPDPPEGWTWADKSKPFDKRAKYWHQYENRYMPQTLGCYTTCEDVAYIVPIDPPAPPEPQYRPFANAKEFGPHRDRWLKEVAIRREARVSMHDNHGFWHDGTQTRISWQEGYVDFTFEDGSPFGVKVEP